MQICLHLDDVIIHWEPNIQVDLWLKVLLVSRL